MISSIKDCAILNNGIEMPWLGLGVYGLDDGGDLEAAVGYALEAGYRSIDTATICTHYVCCMARQILAVPFRRYCIGVSETKTMTKLMSVYLWRCG